MSVKHDVVSFSFNYSGKFNFEDFYHNLFNTIVGLGYTIVEDSHTQKEKGASEKVEVVWAFEKLIDDYTKFSIKVSYIIKNLKKVIVKKGNKEEKTNMGNLELTITGEIITDRLDKWEKTPFLKFLRDFYEKYLFGKTLDDYTVNVFEEVKNIHSSVKSFFNQPVNE